VNEPGGTSVTAGKHFKLEQVLNYRCEIEKIRKQEFATAKRAFEHASDRLRQQKEQVENVSREFALCHEALESIEELRMYADFFTRKREDIKCQTLTVNRLDQAMNDQRQHLLDATKDKKVLESLKEKRTAEFRMRMEQKEQSFLDEISVQKKGVGH
jgi:flagellar FliJ protein